LCRLHRLSECEKWPLSGQVVNTNKKFNQNAVLIFAGAIEIIQKTGYNHNMMFKMGGYVVFLPEFLE